MDTQMDIQEVKHYQINGKYRVVFEKAASANKVDGFKVEVNGDNLDSVKNEAAELYIWANNKVEMNKPVQVPIIKEVKA